MSNPKVSVIIPLYNTREYIEETLHSISHQTLSDIEIIVVNDGSTDDGLSVVERVAAKDPRIKILSQQNQGQAVARNAGFDISAGEYIYFMDSDDLLSLDALKLCYEKCSANRLDFLFFDADILDNAENNYFDTEYYHRCARLEDRTYDGVEIFNIQLERDESRAPLWLNLINRDFIKRTSLKSMPGMKHEDNLFVALMYLQAERVGFIPKPFFKRRLRGNSIVTSKVGYRNIDDYFVIAEHLKIFAKDKNQAVKRGISCYNNGMINAAMRKAYTLALNQRFEFLFRYIIHHMSHFQIKTVAIELFKKPLNNTLRR